MNVLKTGCAMLALFLVLSLLPVQAMGESKKVIVSPETDTQNPIAWELPVVSPSDTLSDLSLPDTIACNTDVMEPWGKPKIYNCSVVWAPDTVDWSTPGRKSVPGQLQPEKGYALAEGFDGGVSFSVFVEGKTDMPEVLGNVNFCGMENSLLPVGGDPAGLDWGSVTVHCRTNVFGEYITPSVAWDTSSIDTAAPGTYTVTGTLSLPEGFVLPPDYPGLGLTVGVVEPDRIDLSAVMSCGAEGLLTCNWLYQPEDKNKIRLDCAVGEGAWEEVPRTEYGWDLGYLNWPGTSLTINLTKLGLYKDYWFRLVDNGQPSTALHIRLQDYNFDFSQLGIGGDRDGGDQEGDQLPSFIQPAPDSQEETPPDSSLPVMQSGPDLSGEEQEAAPAPDPRFEEVTETSTVISRARLQQLCAQNSTVLISKQGVSVELSSQFLLGLDLGEEGLLSVTLKHMQPNGFSLRISAGGQEVTALPETVVRLLWNEESKASLQCVDAAGNIVSDTMYEAESNTVRCIIRETNEYFIQTAEKQTIPTSAPLKSHQAAERVTPAILQAQSKKENGFQLLPGILMAAALTVGAVGARLFWRRWRHG